ncbi:hypothetical protein [Streptomyces chartreusis]|uniref:hypothetical protein n=1 Tax=Streptomyces chartreusis TaxID=1969 RepID=UPI0033ACE3E2
MAEQPAEHKEGSYVENRLSGEAQVYGPVIQAGTIHGNVTVNARGAEQPAVPVLTSVEAFRTSTDVFQWVGSEDFWSPGVGVRVLVEAVSQQAVVLKRMRPVVVSRKPPRPAYIAGEIMGILEVRGFMVNLDADVPVLVPRGSAAPNFPFTVTSGDPELFEVLPSSSFEVEWRLELEWTSAGRSGVTVIDADGKPFRCLPNPLDEGGLLSRG